MHTYAWVYTRSGFHTRVCAKLCMVPHEWKQFRLLHRMTVFNDAPTNSDIHLQQLWNSCLEQLAPTTTFSNHLQQEHPATSPQLPSSSTSDHYLQQLPSLYSATTFNNYHQLQRPTNTFKYNFRFTIPITISTTAINSCSWNVTILHLDEC